MHSWHQLRASIAAARTILTIFITAGSGYFGSTYSTVITDSGQWYADETPIPGATGMTYVMEAQYEGKAITFRTPGFTSNKIQMLTPDQIAGLVGWWDASRADLFALSGSEILTWDTKVAGGSTWTQATSAIRPDYSATGRNGKPAVMVALGDYMTASGPASFPAGGNAGHVFAAAYYSPATITGEWATIVQWGTANSGSRSVVLRNSTSLPGNSVGSAGTDNFLTAPAWLNDDHLVAALTNGTGLDFWLDGQYNISRSATINSLAATATRLFGHMYATGRWVGSCHELFIFQASLGTADRQKMEGYMAHKWGLTSKLAAGHPYKTNPPRTI